MECRLDKNKIKQGIVDSVIAMVNKTELFTVQGDKVISKRETPKSEDLTAEQAEMLESAKKYVDDVHEIYRPYFLEDTESVMREVAKQANSSTSELSGAFEMVGLELFDMAVKIFPNEGLLSEERDAAEGINEAFKSEVLMKVGDNQWTISPSDGLVMQYLMAQPGAGAIIMDDIRAKYLAQIADTSMNLMTDDLWLNHPLLQNPTIQQLLAFAQKINPNFRIGITNDLDANAVSLIGDHIILIREGAIMSELPEEISHFFFELLPDNHPLKVEMLEKIVDMPIYKKVFYKYKNDPAYQKDGHPDTAKIKREAAAQQIAEYIKAAYRNEADEKYGNKRAWLKDIIGRIFKFLRRMFVTNSARKFTEPIVDLTSPFKDSAESILSGDISDLNMQRIFSNYDSIFFSKIEDEMEEGFEASDIAKTMYEFSRAIKKQITQTFNKYVEKENMAGIKELLNQNKDYNKIWDIVQHLSTSGEMLKNMLDTGITDHSTMVRASMQMAEAYNEMEQIPDAISRVLSKMSKDKTESQFIDNITELQNYFKFSDTFATITDEYVRMLSFLKENYPATGSAESLYDRMIEKMGNTELQFRVVDDKIMGMLQDHVIKLTHYWTDEAFSKYRGQVNDMADSTDNIRMKNKIAKLITEKITTPQQIRQAVTGSFPDAKSLITADGKKINISKVKDLSQVDYVIFLFSSPTLIGDPFVSSVMAHFTDRYVAGVFKGNNEAKLFADKITPIKAELSAMGVDWYQAEEAIQNVQTFYDESQEDKKTEKRVFLSATNRFDFQHAKQVKLKELRDLGREINSMQAKFVKGEVPTDETKAKIKEKQDAHAKLLEAYNQWIETYSNRPYTQEYYDKQKNLTEKKTDSEALRETKKINRRIQLLEEQQFVAIALDSTTDNVTYDQITQQLAALQEEKFRLSLQIPETEKSVYEAMEDLYEVDEVASARLRQRHKNKWVKELTDVTMAAGTNQNRADVEEHMSDVYEDLYTISIIKQEFYDKRTAIFDQINAITKPQIGLEALTSRLDTLREQERKLLKPFRDMRGDVNVTSLKYISIEKRPDGSDKLLAESLKDVEEEMDLLKTKIEIYSRIINSTIDEKSKDHLKSLVEVLTSFGQVITSVEPNPQKIKDIFKHIITLSTSQAEQIGSAVQASKNGDHTEFANLAALKLKGLKPSVDVALSMVKFESVGAMLDVEDQLHNTFKGFAKLDNSERSQITALYDELANMYTNGVSMQYHLALKDFFLYFGEYIKDEGFDIPGKDIHKEKFEAFRNTGVALNTVSDIEKFFADGVFEAIIGYMHYTERTNPANGSTYPLDDLIEYMIALHKAKTSYVDGEAETTFTPISYVRKPIADPEMVDKKSPRFLTRNKIKDKYRREKIDELDERVKNGTEEANVDINGEWLPLNKKDSPFHSKEYEALANATDATGKAKFKLLNTLKDEYLQKQVAYLPEGERLDTVIPAKHIDKLEQKKVFATNAGAVWDYIKNSTPFTSGKTRTEEEQNYLEDIQAVTVQNRDIYTGALLAERHVKLRSRRRINLDRTSKDATSSVAMFIEDVNEYSAKVLASPVMKTFSDVFKYAHERNPSSNKLRQGALTDLYLTKILDEVPSGFANNKNLAKVLSTVNKLVTFRLLGDPIGAMVNLTSGTIQQLIEANFSKSEYAMYVASAGKAKSWVYDYEKDFYKGSNWGLHTQLVGLFNMIPDGREVSHQLSKPALLSGVRSKLMYPRAFTEKVLAIHLGLSIVMAEPIIHEAKQVSIEDIYELDPITNLIRLKDEYKSLEKDWNPADGEMVRKLRRRLMQKYTLLQGNFYKQNQSFASTTAIGRSAEIMKRWFASGVIRRFQGEVIDVSTGETRKGYHIAMVNLLGSIFQGIKTGDMAYIREYWKTIGKSKTEQQALRKSLAELLYITVFGILCSFVLGYDNDDKDKNKKLREMSYMKQLALLISIRVQGELGTFVPVPVFGLGYMEMKRAILDPIGLPKTGFDNIMGMGALIFMQTLSALGMNFDKALYYQKGKPYGYNFGGIGAFKDKGDSKLIATFLNTIGYTGYTFEPAEYIKMLTQMQQRLK